MDQKMCIEFFADISVLRSPQPKTNGFGNFVCLSHKSSALSVYHTVQCLSLQPKGGEPIRNIFWLVGIFRPYFFVNLKSVAVVARKTHNESLKVGANDFYKNFPRNL